MAPCEPFLGHDPEPVSLDPDLAEKHEPRMQNRFSKPNLSETAMQLFRATIIRGIFFQNSGVNN
jgi:hypothetical protein